jgi:Uncharacterised MFS-type transporter YbfB
VQVVLADEAVLHSSAQDQQAAVLNGAERERSQCPWAPAEDVWLVMVARTVTILGPGRHGRLYDPRAIRTGRSAWWVAGGLALGPAVALGLARFAYGLLLPAMRSDLDWSYGLAGTMTTANALGYLLGALVAAPLSAHLGGLGPVVVGLLSDGPGGVHAGLAASAATLCVGAGVALLQQEA